LDVDAELAAGTDHLHAARPCLACSAVRVTGGEKRDLMADPGQTVGDVLGIDLGAAAVRVLGVAPVEDE
jgi:hypothetical protein